MTKYNKAPRALFGFIRNKQVSDFTIKEAQKKAISKAQTGVLPLKLSMERLFPNLLRQHGN